MKKEEGRKVRSVQDRHLPACFSAGESFTPSPVIAVTLPAFVNS